TVKPTEEKQKKLESDDKDEPAKKDGFSQLLLGAKRQAALNATAKSSGLVNLGNTCYMNAVLQALLSLQAFVACLRDDAWVAALTKQALAKGYWSNKANKEAYEFYLCFKDMIKDHVESAHLDPGPMKAVVGKRAQAFANNAQQDAHEFLMSVLFELEEDMKGVLRQQREIVSKNTEQKKASKQSIHQYFNGSQPETQAIDNIEGLLPTTTFFQTTITQTLTCTSCGYSRHLNETFRELPLDFPPAIHAKPTLLCHCQRPVHRLITKKEGENKGRPFLKCSQFPQCKFFQWDDNPVSEPEGLNVPQLLAKYFEAYSVDVKCEKCSDGATAKVTLSILKAPPVLVLHLKRFEISTSSYTLVKRNDVVAAPIIIDINSYRNSSAKSKPAYHIKSIIRHIGKTAGEGHYVTDIRHDKGSKWTRYNDAHVSEIDAAQVLQGAGAENGYLLFYVRDK
ncbi:ubiquitin-specific protease, partial [Thraustotheca clavata]